MIGNWSSTVPDTSLDLDWVEIFYILIAILETVTSVQRLTLALDWTGAGLDLSI